MKINLDPWCERCPDFDPVKENILTGKAITTTGLEFKTETCDITCRYRSRCRMMIHYLRLEGNLISLKK